MPSLLPRTQLDFVEQRVEFRLGIAVKDIVVRNGAAIGVRTDEGVTTADQVVVDAGSYSRPLLRVIGIKLSVRPAKGYSISVANPPAANALSMSIVDDHLHAVGIDASGSLTMVAPEEFPAIAEGLGHAGFSDDEVRGILGENWLRVAQAVWR